MGSVYLTWGIRLWVLGALCFLWGRATASAQTLTDERKAVVVLYNHLKFTFDRNSKNALLLVWPGLPIPNLADGVTLDDYHVLSDLVDGIPRAETLYSSTAGRVDQQLKYILDNKVTAKIELTPEEKKQLQSAFNALHNPKTGEDTLEYDFYENLLANYDEDIDEIYNERFIALEKGPLSAVQEQAFKAREDKLTLQLLSNPIYKKVQECFATIDRLTNKDGLVWWYEVRSQFEHQWLSSPSGRFPHTEYFPILSDWEKPHGWTKVTLNTNIVRSVPLERLPIPPKDVPDVAFINLSGTSKPGNPTFTFTTELKRIEIARPWLESEVFHNHTWKLEGVTATSEGLFLQKDSTLADMPLLITGMILARNTEVRLDYPTKAEAEAKKGLTSFGPISLAAKLLWGKGILQPKTDVIPIAGGKYEVVSSSKNIEIIGFICERIPRSPLPDPKYKF